MLSANKTSTNLTLYSNMTIFEHMVLLESFSNSLIIHKEKTKEITAVMVVWIPNLN